MEAGCYVIGYICLDNHSEGLLEFREVTKVKQQPILEKYLLQDSGLSNCFPFEANSVSHGLANVPKVSHLIHGRSEAL